MENSPIRSLKLPSELESVRPEVEYIVHELFNSREFPNLKRVEIEYSTGDHPETRVLRHSPEFLKLSVVTNCPDRYLRRHLDEGTLDYLGRIARLSPTDHEALCVGIERGDLLQAAFQMISLGYESACERFDKHGRVTFGGFSIGIQAILTVPIVHFLLLPLKPSPDTTPRRMHLTADIDCFSLWDSQNAFTRITGHLLRRKNWTLFSRELGNYIGSRVGWTRDYHDHFDYLTPRLAPEGVECSSTAFALLAARHLYDVPNRVRSARYRRRLQELSEQGIHVGIHPSYLCTEQPSLFSEEVALFEEIIGRRPVRARTHCLRGTFPDIYRLWERNGIEEDYSLGFADSIGFRGGYSGGFRPWNWKERRPFSVRLFPLTIMDRTLTDPAYMGLNRSESVRKSSDLCRLAWAAGASVELLWHNSVFYQPFREFTDGEVFYDLMNELRTVSGRVPIAPSAEFPYSRTLASL